MIFIYIDLDGCINVLSKKPPKQNTQWFGQWYEKPIEGYRILWSSELIEELISLSTRDDVVIKFLTTWRGLAPSSFGPQVGLLGSSLWEFLDATDDELEDFSNWWKLDRIKTDIEAHKPDKVVWIDDDISYEPNALAWLKEYGSNILSISPHSTHGITKSHMRLINEFVGESFEERTWCGRYLCCREADHDGSCESDPTLLDTEERKRLYRSGLTDV